MTGLAFREITHTNYIETDLDDARRLLAGEITEYTTPKRYVRRDKSLACVKLTVSLARNALSEPEHFVFVVEDIASRQMDEGVFRTLADPFRNRAGWRTPKATSFGTTGAGSIYTGKGRSAQGCPNRLAFISLTYGLEASVPHCGSCKDSGLQIDFQHIVTFIDHHLEIRSALGPILLWNIGHFGGGRWRRLVRAWGRWQRRSDRHLVLARFDRFRDGEGSVLNDSHASRT